MELIRMTRRRLIGMGVLAVVAGLIAASGLTQAEDERPREHPGPGSHFLRLGRYYINENRLNYVASKGKGLELVFGGEGQGHLVVDGPLAEAMVRWLDARPEFVRCGPNYLNLGRLNYVVSENDTLELNFGPEGRDRLLLTGSAADTFGHWLNERSSGPQILSGKGQSGQPSGKGPSRGPSSENQGR